MPKLYDFGCKAWQKNQRRQQASRESTVVGCTPKGVQVGQPIARGGLFGSPQHKPFMKHFITRIALLVRWALGVILLLAGLGNLATGDIIPSLFIIALSFLVTPLSGKYLFNRLKWRIPAWAKVVLGFVLLVGFGLTTSPSLSIAAKSPTNESPTTVEVVYIAGKTVKLYHNDVDLGEKQTDKNRKALFENIELSEGDNNFRAEVIGEDKNLSRVIVYDTTPPDKPSVNLASEVHDKNLQVGGASEPNATIKIFFNGSEARTVKTDKNGEFSSKFVLSNPDNSFEFEAIDSAGNSSGLTDKISVTYVDTKKIANEEKKAKREADKAQKEQATADKKRAETEAKKAEEEQVKKQQQEDLTNLYNSAKNLYDLSDKGNELVAKSLIGYSSLKISRATLYSYVKDTEAAQDKIWGGLVDLGHSTPESLKEYEKEITGFEGGIVYLQVSVKLRKEAMGELAKYIDTGSLQNMRSYETKLREGTSYAVNGFLKLRAVGEKVGVELE